MDQRIQENLIQGTPEWHNFRLTHYGASEAAAMLGISKYVTRSDLMHQKHTGESPEVDSFKQAIFDNGHETEAKARPLMEAIIGEELYPVTYSMGLLSASCDGLTASDEIAFEHKQWNKELAEAVMRKELPDDHQAQCQQIMMVTGAGKVFFTVSDGTPKNFVYMEVFPDAEWQKRIAAGWKQFHEDLKTYTPPEVIPAPVATPIKELPALSIEIMGSVVASNLTEWKDIVTERIAGINTDLQTDQDFVDAAEMVKFLDEGEKRIALVKSQAQSQATSIDEVFRALDEISAEMKSKRLALDRLVTARKVSIKEEIRRDGEDAFKGHIAMLNTRIGKPYMPAIATDFPGVMKSKRTIATLRDAVSVELARARTAADEVAEKIEANLKQLRELAKDHAFLFSDTAQLVLKDTDAVEAIIKSRIAEHNAAEEKRKEAEREAIRKEEEAKAAAKLKAEADAAAKVKADAEAAEKKQQEDAQALLNQAHQTVAVTIEPAQPAKTAQAQFIPLTQVLDAVAPPAVAAVMSQTEEPDTMDQILGYLEEMPEAGRRLVLSFIENTFSKKAA